MEQRFSELLKQIYSAVADLEAMFPGRHFTPDGHMVGSIGETLAAHYYGITLYPPSHPKFDGHKDGKEIQIKATQKDRVILEHGAGVLLVLQIAQDGTFEDVYNGNASRAWQSLSHRSTQKTGGKSISLKQLRVLQKEVQEEEKIARQDP